MKYTTLNGIHIVEVPVSDFRIVMVDERKKNTGRINLCNAGFFQNFDEGKTAFTLPVGHVVADFAASCSWVGHYCKVRGSVSGGKVSFDSGSWDRLLRKFQKDHGLTVDGSCGPLTRAALKK